MEPRSLSKEELQALTLYANGLSTDEIGERLSVNKSVVQDRLRVAMRKLGAVNRVHAVALATDQRIIRIAGSRGRQRIWPDLADDDPEMLIRERAYQIWLDAGKPHGFDKQHWAQAEAEVLRNIRKESGDLLPANELADRKRLDR